VGLRPTTPKGPPCLLRLDVQYHLAEQEGVEVRVKVVSVQRSDNPQPQAPRRLVGYLSPKRLELLRSCLLTPDVGRALVLVVES
jgi:hypothetical protein